MDYNTNINKIGRVKEINKELGVGKIIDIDNIYLFTINDIKEDINVGDIVKFRGENVKNTKKAFFVNKITEDYEIKDNYIKSKIYKPDNY